MEDCSNSKASAGAVAALPDDLLLEILSRVPAKSICRFKCVSKAWRDLIADPDHRKKLRQAMQGLFFTTRETGHLSLSFGFLDLTAGSVVDPALSFLTERPGNHKLYLLDSCNGLMLLEHRSESPPFQPLGYIVCNPTTKQWQAVPNYSGRRQIIHTYLAFDPVVSSHFHLVQFEQTGIYWEPKLFHVYSSETGTWSHHNPRGREIHNQTDDEEEDPGQSQGWWQVGDHLSLTDRCAFVNGFMHFLVDVSDKRQIAVLDVQGRVRRMIRLPNVDTALWRRNLIYFGQSQGYLHCITEKAFDVHEERYELSIWVLQDYDTEEWVLKDTVSSAQLFGEKCPRGFIADCEVADMHLDRNVVFFFSPCEQKFRAYDMDRKKMSVFGTSKHIIMVKVGRYVPCFSESPAPIKNKHRKCMLEV